MSRRFLNSCFVNKPLALSAAAHRESSLIVSYLAHLSVISVTNHSLPGSYVHSTCDPEADPSAGGPGAAPYVCSICRTGGPPPGDHPALEAPETAETAHTAGHGSAGHHFHFVSVDRGRGRCG